MMQLHKPSAVSFRLIGGDLRSAMGRRMKEKKGGWRVESGCRDDYQSLLGAELRRYLFTLSRLWSSAFDLVNN